MPSRRAPARLRRCDAPSWRSVYPMKVEEAIVQQIRDAVLPKSDTRGSEPSADALTAAVGIATVVADYDLLEGAPGVFWYDEKSRGNALMLLRNQFVHAVVTHNGVEATNYVSPIDSVRAADFEKVGGDVIEGWAVLNWHLTLRDGSVIALQALSTAHADELSDFVRLYVLQPAGASPGL